MQLFCLSFFYKRYRKFFACRSCHGGHLLLPVAAKVNKNALERVGKTARRKQVHSHNYLTQNGLKLAGAQTVRPFCRAVRDRSAYAAGFVNASR